MEPSQDSVKKTPRLKEMFDKFRKVFQGERFGKINNGVKQ